MKSTTDRYKIERGLPVPETKRGGQEKGHLRFTRFPFDNMQVGDSFFIPDGDPPNCQATAEKRGMKITSRKVPGGYRVWRLA